MIVPGPAGYSYYKVAVAGTYFKYQLCLKRCDAKGKNVMYILPSIYTCTVEGYS